MTTSGRCTDIVDVEPTRGLGLRVVGETPTIDLDGAERAVGLLLRALGADPESEHLIGTPRRVASALAELLTPKPFALTTFANDEKYHELVLVRDIPFRSLCEHHLLPFHGVAHVGYIPAGRILGLSKLSRVVDHVAADLQTQERLTMQVADWLGEHLDPVGVGVVLEADHMCMSLRGARAIRARTRTSTLRGSLRHDAHVRQEFFSFTSSIPTGRGTS